MLPHPDALLPSSANPCLSGFGYLQRSVGVLISHAVFYAFLMLRLCSPPILVWQVTVAFDLD